MLGAGSRRSHKLIGLQFGSSMALHKKAKGSSKNKSKGGKEKDGKSKEPFKPQITVSDALEVRCILLRACVDKTTSDVDTRKYYAVAQPQDLHLNCSVI